MYNDNLTVDGHLIGMLHRDLRTMKTTEKTLIANDSVNCFCKTCRRNCMKSNYKRVWKNQQNLVHNRSSSCSSNVSYSRNLNKSTTSRFFNRLGEVFVLGACLLSVLRIPTVLTAPIEKTAMDLNDKPRWINPCGISSDFKMVESSTPLHSQLESIEVTSKNALAEAKHFRNEYVKHTFHVEFDDQHNKWKTLNYENWLPKFEKSLGENTPEEHLATLEIDTSLKDNYKNLQVFAAALERVAFDMKNQNAVFYEHFNQAFLQVNSILCEYQEIMAERKIEPHENVTRDVMKGYQKMPSATERNLRDWVIFREYMNALEYTIDVWSHLRKASQAE